MYQWPKGPARQLNERRKSRGKGRQKAGQPLAARCMQIKWKQRGRLSLLVCETREGTTRSEKEMGREEMEGPTKQEDPIKPPSRPHAGGKASRHAFYYYEITARPCRAAAKRVAGKNCAPATMSALIARPLKRGGHHESPFGACDTRTCLSRAALVVIIPVTFLA